MTTGRQNAFHEDMSERRDIQKVAVVTGASRGIGKAIAMNLAREDIHVICVSRSEASYSSVVEDIRSQGGSAEGVAVDVASFSAVSDACSSLLEKHHAIDILVNNAGITRDNLMLRMKEEEWDDVIQTNLNSCFNWVKNLLHPMTKQRWGRIINISSVVGIHGNFGQCNYAAAKAGIIGFTKALAQEVAGRNITVNAIAPGFIDTDMTKTLSESITDAILKSIPMKKWVHRTISPKRYDFCVQSLPITLQDMY